MFTELTVMESFGDYLANHSIFLSGMGIFLLGLVAAIAGGFVGAAIGGNFAFVMTGFCVLFAFGVHSLVPDSGNFAFTFLAFGPLFGPHISFGGGAAAAAYAAHKGYIETGKEITGPLARLGKMDVLLVGAGFGVLGYLVNLVICLIPWFGGHTDNVALTVVASAIIARLAFGDSAVGKASILNKEKLLAKPNEKDSFMGVWDIDPENGNVWLEWQARPRQFLPVGFIWGMFGAFAALCVAIFAPNLAGNASGFPFALSAVIILFLCCGFNTQVQHHITIIGGLAGVAFFPILMGEAKYTPAGAEEPNTWAYYFQANTEFISGASDKFFLMAAVALIIGGIFGAISATLGEVFARIWYNRGTTHIDPPASAIWPSTTLIWLCLLPFGSSLTAAI